MRNLLIPYLLLLLFSFAVFSGIAQAQSAVVPAGRAAVFTDRYLYVTGEKIMFQAAVLNGSKADAQEKVLYCELITPEGSSISQGKFELAPQGCTGYLSIPSDIAGGYYYLKAYTRSMRNYSPENYGFQLLKIVNPLKSDILEGIAADSALVMRTPDHEIQQGTVCSVSKPGFYTGENGLVSINANAIESMGLQLFSLSIVPEGAWKPFRFSPRPPQQLPAERFYPETRGITLTGRLVNKASQTPLAGYTINLSLIGDAGDVMACKTDSAGSFHFALPAATGTHDLFLSAEKRAELNAVMLIDNDFSPACAVLPSPPFSLDSLERTSALVLAANQQVKQYFATAPVLHADTVMLNNRAFYGKPTKVMVLDKYIQLPTLEEYFNELPTTVRIRKKQGKKYFKLPEINASLSIFDPLVMVDMVVVDDIERILTVSPQAVARIEIVTEPYVKGDFTYGGIINIISKKGDFAGIDLPSTGMFLNYRFYDDTAAGNPQEPAAAGSPDARNTLLWKPLSLPAGDGISPVEFTASGKRGNYVVVLQGIDRQGNLYRESHPFTVK